ncbi:MAG: DNA polymerase III subunit delta [Thiotrichales bacterium]|nr:DNA polymerase III subunit delta [Thiotrichales bacterium]
MLPAAAFLKQVSIASFQIAPIFLFYGEELLYLRDCWDALRVRLQQEGLIATDSFDADASFDWQVLQMTTQSGSLFAERQYLRLNLPKGNPGTEGTAFIQQFCVRAKSNPDMVLLLFCEKLDSRQLKSKWVQVIEAAGLVVQAKTIERAALPNWILQRAQNYGLSLDAAAAALLAERTEGNLLAADQELIKLSLSLLPQATQQIGAEQIANSVVDQTHYQLYALSSAVLQGQRLNAAQILQRLRQEGVELLVVLWLLSKELRLLAELQFCTEQMPLAQAFKQCEIWSINQGDYRQALARGLGQNASRYLAQALQLDVQSKGLVPSSGEAERWSALHQLVTQMAS